MQMLYEKERNKMKRIISLSMVILLLAALFVGCDVVSEFLSPTTAEGLYELKSVSGMDVRTFVAKLLNRTALSDQEVNALLQKGGIKSLEQCMMLEMREDGSFTAYAVGNKKIDGSWRLDGSKIIINGHEYDFKTGDIVMEYAGETIVMTKVKDDSVNINAIGNYSVDAESTEETDPANMVDTVVDGEYLLEAVNGMDLRTYIDDKAARANTDADTQLANLGVSSIDELAERAGFILNPDGTASFGHLSDDGIETHDGDWRQVGELIILTVFNAEQTSSNGGVSYGDAVQQCTFHDGVLTATDDTGSVCVYRKHVIGSAAGTYYVQSVDGESLGDYYVSMAGETGVNLDALLELAGVQSADELGDKLSFTLKADGTGTYEYLGTQGIETKTASWKQEGDKVKITVHGTGVHMSADLVSGESTTTYSDSVFTYSFRDGKLTMTDEHNAVWIYVRTAE